MQDPSPAATLPLAADIELSPQTELSRHSQSFDFVSPTERNLAHRYHPRPNPSSNPIPTPSLTPTPTPTPNPNQVFVMPITAPGDKAEIGSVQSHWPGCNVRGLCCAGNANNNYAVVFPPSATPEQKARLLSAVHLIDLNMFERRQNQK